MPYALLPTYLSEETRKQEREIPREIVKNDLERCFISFLISQMQETIFICVLASLVPSSVQHNLMLFFLISKHNSIRIFPHFLSHVLGTVIIDPALNYRLQVLKLLEKESIKWSEERNGRTIVIRLDEIDPKGLSFAKKSSKKLLND